MEERRKNIDLVTMRGEKGIKMSRGFMRGAYEGILKKTMFTTQ